ncbi:MAG: hypothetical protein IPP88_08995 [Betaproteobacteria bacterium]|nr:hypothetical protein [Betaproteobacteria bacterium]
MLRTWPTSVEARVDLADRAAKGASGTSHTYTLFLRTVAAFLSDRRWRRIDCADEFFSSQSA